MFYHLFMWLCSRGYLCRCCLGMKFSQMAAVGQCSLTAFFLKLKANYPGSRSLSWKPGVKEGQSKETGALIKFFMEIRCFDFFSLSHFHVWYNKASFNMFFKTLWSGLMNALLNCNWNKKAGVEHNKWFIILKKKRQLHLHLRHALAKPWFSTCCCYELFTPW